MMNLLKKDFSALSTDSPLYPYRKKSWDVLQSLPSFPFPATEEIGTTPSADTPLENVRSFLYPECEKSSLVFVNGTFCPHLSDLSLLPNSLVVLPLSVAEKNYPTFLKERLAALIEEDKSPLMLANLALHHEGCFLYIPPKITLKNPIACLHFITQNTQYLFPRLHLSFGEASHAQVILQTKVLSTTAPFSHFSLDLALEKHASCHITQLLAQEGLSFQGESLRATLKKSSQLKVVSVSKGSSQGIFQDDQVLLLEEGASASLQGISLLEEQKKSEVQVAIEHRAPRTTSQQHFKGVLRAYSRFRFKGKIKVLKEAEKTESYQLNNHLVLSENAFSESEPTLEIFASDVKASHGATVAQIEPKQLLYLKTRGIDEELGKQLLISGFAQEITTQIPHLFLLKELLKDPFFRPLA